MDHTKELIALAHDGSKEARDILVLENMGLMGVPYPEFIKKALEVMKDKGNDAENKD